MIVIPEYVCYVRIERTILTAVFGMVASFHMCIGDLVNRLRT